VTGLSPDDSRRRAWRGLRFGICALLALCACARENPGDVLLITVDTLRSDHLGLYGYERATSPHIDRWFADATIFERAYATSASTSPSVVSILTGQLPKDHRVRLFYQLLPEGARLLPDLLPDVYQSAAFVSNIVLTDEAMGIARHFDYYDDWVDERESTRPIFERKARRTTNAALRWLVEARDPDRPLLLWVHYIDPHGPYRPPEEATTSFDHEGEVPLPKTRIARYQYEPGVDDALAYIDRYDEEVAYVDGEVGRLLEGYARRHDPDAALLIFAADHGESMIEHERWFTHGYHVYEEIIRVPLMIRGPGMRAGRRPEVVSLIDLVPTIQHFARGSHDAALPGVPLQRMAKRSSSGIVFAEGGGERLMIRAAIQGDRKWMARSRAGQRRPTEGTSFDLGEDPGELAPQSWLLLPDEDASRELLEHFESDPDPGGQPESMRKGIRIGAPKVAPRADAEALERLRALGYVE
jgi:arylsulfatase